MGAKSRVCVCGCRTLLSVLVASDCTHRGGQWNDESVCGRDRISASLSSLQFTEAFTHIKERALICLTRVRSTDSWNELKQH